MYMILYLSKFLSHKKESLFLNLDIMKKNILRLDLLFRLV